MSSSILSDSPSSSTRSDTYTDQTPLPTIPCRDSTNVFSDIVMIKTINKAKFPVYLVCSRLTKQQYAMKAFPYTGNKPHHFFQNEARFCFMDHPHVIKSYYAEREREVQSQGYLKKISFLIMEYAPYGDFFDFVAEHAASFDDKLIRSYFRQLIEGLEYLHDNGISHMDIKLENLLMGTGFQLKIADFDLSCLKNEEVVQNRGTKFYRAPEVIEGRCTETQKADMYSAGIVLFTLKTKGVLPHTENTAVAGINFEDILYNSNGEFWKKHCEIQKRDENYFDQDFKDLFNSLVKQDPSKRATISQIKKSKWYNRPCYSNGELTNVVRDLFKIYP